jgi:hypothetical protein
MFWEYIREIFSRVFFICLFGIWIVFPFDPPLEVWALIIGSIIFLAAYWTYNDKLSTLEGKYKEEANKILRESEQVIADAQSIAKNKVDEAELIVKQALKDENLWKQSLLERNLGFKTLLTYIALYEKLRDEPVSNFLINKKHPAAKAADIVKEQTRLRRKAEFENRKTQALIELYENYAPFLIDLKDEVPDIQEEIFEGYTEQERGDEVAGYLRVDEYRNLPPSERHQLALDRFWSRPKSKWMIGKIYERYIGYLYEQKGFQVEYFGITERFEDLGRDLICCKGNEVHIVQCKNWSQFRTIYEKHIFQLFGTAFEYKYKHPNLEMHAVFYCTNGLSEIAKKMADELGIEVNEYFELVTPYPVIKCNISTKDNEKIYHLPFDQKYDATKIDRPGEFYCTTVAEAENAGFRRAWRWHGQEN